MAIVVDSAAFPTGATAAINSAAVSTLQNGWTASQVHEVGAVPAKPATPYAVVSVSSGMATNTRGDGTHGAKDYRIVVQVVGKTASEVSFGIDKVDGAFLDKSLPVAGLDTTPAASEVSSSPIRDPDGGVLLSVTQTYTFTAYPTA